MTHPKNPATGLSNEGLSTLILSLLPGSGPARLQQWLDGFGSAEKVLQQDPNGLPRFPDAARELWQDHQKRGEHSGLHRQALEIQQRVADQQATIITLDDSRYPPLLKQTSRPPGVLYAKGNATLLQLPQIAVVGTRNPTQAGLQNTCSFARHLAQSGFTVTSGLALGVDGAAHNAAAPCAGKTIAVMATGIDRVYPKRHQLLADSIVQQGGLLLSEFTPGSTAVAAHFPQRNRIISGLSLGVLVVEAAVKSGSLITARYALEQNREVFCLPGSIHNPQSRGCHQLIREGAHLVEKAADIVRQCRSQLGALTSLPDRPGSSGNNICKNTDKPLTGSKPDTSDTNEKILAALEHETQELDDIIERTQLPADEVSAQLMLLELEGRVSRSVWGYERGDK